MYADDLDISPDFFEYFAATYPILHNDPTLWCVSAWNDNGKSEVVENNAGLYSSLPLVDFCMFWLATVDFLVIFVGVKCCHCVMCAELLYRTDFFPGLGWMLEKRVWSVLESKWPAALVLLRCIFNAIQLTFSKYNCMQ